MDRLDRASLLICIITAILLYHSVQAQDVLEIALATYPPPRLPLLLF